MSKTKNTKLFIEKATQIHHDLYNYSKVDYKKSSRKVIIVCKKHGKFLQSPSTHLCGEGCIKCSIERHTKSIQQFIKEANNIHGYKYNYSLVNYKNNINKVIIICKKHGKFLQSPCDHLRAHGCSKCGLDKKTKTINNFIAQCINIHGNKYDYSKVNYKNTLSKVIIICKKHGSFSQIPSNHLKGHGCKKCSKIILNDNEVCDSLVEAFRYLQYKKNKINFIHNGIYDKKLGKKRYDFYFPDLKIYEEITSYNLNKDARGIGLKIKEKYLKNIKEKKKFVESIGCTFRFIKVKDLTKKQREYVFVNSKDF